jgi:hypothetical protein
MLYPLNRDCDVNPLVTMRNIKVRNVHIQGGIFPPGVIRCNATNPCTGFEFTNVNVTGWFTQQNIGYITENVIGSSINALPDPGFNSTISEQQTDEIVAKLTSHEWYTSNDEETVEY